MGNHLASPPADYHLYDLRGPIFHKTLGGRLLKTFQCILETETRTEGDVVVKAFYNNDRASLDKYEKAINDQRELLAPKPPKENRGLMVNTVSNVMPWQKAVRMDRTGFAYLMRQYFPFSLRDRLSSRPVLLPVEKKWLSYQLLSALVQCHAARVIHGDIKSENAMLTTWNWLFLTDFSPYLPVLLPLDNPAIFSFYYDTSGRRSCYLAPERFVPSGELQALSATAVLQPAMDIFSAGCVIAELWLDGKPVFDFSSLLAYRRGESRVVETVLSAINDEEVRNMIAHMLQLDPTARFSAEEYLRLWRGRVFPAFFERMHPVLGQLAWLDSDEKITGIARELPAILYHLTGDVHAAERFVFAPPPPPLSVGPGGSVIAASPTSTAVSQASSTAATGAAPAAAGAAVAAAPALHAPSSQSRLATSRAEAADLASGAADSARLLQDTQQFLAELDGPLPPPAPVLQPQPGVASRHSDALLPLPASAVTVRNRARSPSLLGTSRSRSGSLVSQAPTTELAALWSGVGDAGGVAVLLTAVCVALRSARAASSRIRGVEILTALAAHAPDHVKLERLLPYEVTLLTDKAPAVRMRAVRGITALLRMVETVPADEAHVFAEYVLPALAPLTQDPDDAVRMVLAECVPQIAEAGRRFLVAAQLAQKSGVSTTAAAAAGAADLTSGAAEWNSYEEDELNILQGVLQLVKPFLTDPSDHVKRALLSDISRLCGFFGLSWTNDSLIPLLLTFLNVKSWDLRWSFFHTIVGVCAFVGPESLTSFLLPCIVQGLEDEEEFVIAKAMRALATLCDLSLFLPDGLSEVAQKAAPLLCHPNTWIRYAAISFFVAAGRRMPLADLSVRLLPIVRPFVRRDALAGTRVMSPSLLTELGLMESLRPPLSREMYDKAVDQRVFRGADYRQPALDADARTSEEIRETLQLMEPVILRAADHLQGKTRTTDDDQARLLPPSIPRHVAPLPSQGGFNLKEYGSLIDSLPGRPLTGNLLNGWTPESGGGILFTLAEHKAAVTSLAVSKDNSFFASGSEDGAVKIWDCKRLETKIKNRPRLNYTQLGGRITSLAMVEDSHSVVCGSTNGSVHVFRVEVSQTPSASNELKYSAAVNQRTVDGGEGAIISVSQFTALSDQLLLYTTQGNIVHAWDMRARTEAWSFRVPGRYGVITSVAVDPQRVCLSVGTRRGVIQCWDARFLLPVVEWRHPAAMPVNKLLHAPQGHGHLYVASGPNELSLWEISHEPTCKQMFRSVPAGSRSEPAIVRLPVPRADSDFGMSELIGRSDVGTAPAVRSLFVPNDGSYVVTAGDDRRIRYWNMRMPNESFVVAHPMPQVPGAPPRFVAHKAGPLTLFQENAELHAPTHTPLQPMGAVSVSGASAAAAAAPSGLSSATSGSGAAGAGGAAGGPSLPPSGHSDAILDVVALEKPLRMLITAGRDGLIKVWK